MKSYFCENCGLPGGPHKTKDCFKELVRSRKLAEEMFDSALMVLSQLGEPVKIRRKDLQGAVLNLEMATWEYAK